MWCDARKKRGGAGVIEEFKKIYKKTARQENNLHWKKTCTDSRKQAVVV